MNHHVMCASWLMACKVVVSDANFGIKHLYYLGYPDYVAD